MHPAVLAHHPSQAPLSAQPPLPPSTDSSPLASQRIPPTDPPAPGPTPRPSRTQATIAMWSTRWSRVSGRSRTSTTRARSPPTGTAGSTTCTTNLALGVRPFACPLTTARPACQQCHKHGSGTTPPQRRAPLLLTRALTHCSQSRPNSSSHSRSHIQSIRP